MVLFFALKVKISHQNSQKDLSPNLITQPKVVLRRLSKSRQSRTQNNAQRGTLARRAVRLSSLLKGALLAR